MKSLVLTSYKKFNDLEFPRIWFSQIRRTSTKPWKLFKVDGVLMNAYEFLQNNKAYDSVTNKGIHKEIEYAGPIMMDSGGFFFMKKNEIDITPKDIISFYEKTKPNFGVVLDHPLFPDLTKNQILKRQLETLANTKTMLKHKKTRNPHIVPVIHGYDEKQIEWFVKKLKKIKNFQFYSIGSLVPSLYNVKDVGGLLNVVKIVNQVKSLLPRSKIHVLGTGSALTMHLMFYAGADSLDTSAWRTKAAYGAIQMVGTGDRWISKNVRSKKYTQLSREEKKILEDCKCTSCKSEGIIGLREKFDNRAIHNAWIYQKEVSKARKMIHQNSYDKYVEELLKNTRLSNMLNEIKNLRN